MALHHLSVSTVSCSRIPIGEGTVWTDHGQLPVPAFATMRLLIGMKTCQGPGEMNGTVTGELVTPTAAALLRVLTGVADFEHAKKEGIQFNGVVRMGRPPAMTPRAVGLGAGTKDFIKHPNVIRLIIGDEAIFDDGKAKHVKPGVPLDDGMSSLAISNSVIQGDLVSNVAENKSIETKLAVSSPKKEFQPDIDPKSENDSGMPWKIDKLTLLQANLDDITSEVLSYVLDLLLKNGAIDVWIQPIVMKKGRSAHQINCLFHSPHTNSNSKNDDTAIFSRLMEIIFRHTTTIGVRVQRDIERAALERKIIQVQTIYGAGDDEARNGLVDVKLGILYNEAVSIKAEFDHCKIISEHTGIPLKIIADYATKEARVQLQQSDLLG